MQWILGDNFPLKFEILYQLNILCKAEREFRKYLTIRFDLFSAEMRGNELFLVFHNHGYTIFEVNQCHMEHHVTGDYNFPTADGSLAALTLCRSNDSCSWGDAVIVGNKFVYISQQSNKRIVVLEITDRSNPVEVRLGMNFFLDLLRI